MKKLDIIYEDKEFLVVNKEPNLLTIATEKQKVNTLYHEASAYVKKQYPKNKVFIVHRLDKDTSGIVLFAKNKELKEALQNNWDRVAKEREYIAVVEGIVKESGEIRNYLYETKTLEVKSTNAPNKGKIAITNYKPIQHSKQYSLLEIHIQTGRKNQIRVHMKNIYHPIIGDKKYGANKNPLRRLGLHAKKLVLIHPLTKKEYIFQADVPKEFEKITKEKK